MNNQFEGTSDADKWEKYITALEALGTYGCLGITDYFSVDGFKKAREFKMAGRMSDISFLLPNIELRIVPVTGSEKAINMHLLVDPKIADDLDDLLFSNLHFVYQGNQYKATRTGIVGLGRAFANDSTLDQDSAYIKGIEQFKIEVSQLRNCLSAHPLLSKHSLVAVANSSNDGNSGIQDSGLAALRQEIYRLSHCIFSGNPNDRAYFLGLRADNAEQVRATYGSTKPCIHGCDAHDLLKIGKPDFGRHTWIKADTTFEGLRQICHQPGERVHIGPFPPPDPVHRIRRIDINLPSSTTTRWNEVDSPFCLRGSSSILFASGLTCIIGGRGAGKSTLLNVVHEALAPGENEYFKNQRPRVDGAAIHLADLVKAEFLGNQAGLEFISQNQVEEFALDPSRLTKAIFARLPDNGSLESSLAAVAERRETLSKLAKLVLDKARHEGQVRTKKEAREALHTLLASFNDPEYTATSNALRDATQISKQLSLSRARLAEALNAMETVASRIPQASESDDRSAQALSKFLSAVRSAIAEAKTTVDVKKPMIEEVTASAEADALRKKLEVFLSSRGYSAENLNDVAAASTRIADLSAEIDDSERLLASIAREIAKGQADSSPREAFEAILATHLEELNGIFADVHSDVKRIEIRYRFDREAANETLISLVGDDVERVLGKRLRSDHIEMELQKGGDFLLGDAVTLLEVIRASATQTAATLDAYFSENGCLEAFTHLRSRIALDVVSYMRLDILYDGNTLARSSFGQRCSAVLVVLLSLGNTPIMIDEPEAHLDSSIIANYLVDLVKTVKKRRQVIFATHNANFVINGDAELIHVVEMDNGQLSTILPITIEDMEARPLLLALEGGERAFMQREGRYALSD
jgi:exonuclease SbcC